MESRGMKVSRHTGWAWERVREGCREAACCPGEPAGMERSDIRGKVTYLDLIYIP